MLKISTFSNIKKNGTKKFEYFLKKALQKFGRLEKTSYLCIAFEKNAEVAQLVEHNLAKVRVAGPSPVFRSLEEK